MNTYSIAREISRLCVTIAVFTEIVLAQQAAQNKPTVSIYFESQCPGSRYFFKNILANHKEDMDARRVNLEFVPFGFGSHRESPDGIDFNCQHGRTECYGNKMLSCAIHSIAPERSPMKRKREDDFTGHKKEQYASGQNALLRFMICAMSMNYPPKAGERCAKQTGVSWLDINKCLYSKTGEELLLAMEKRTNGKETPVRLLPWIEYDGLHYDKSYPNFIESYREFLSKRNVTKKDSQAL